ncbi:hypothetical protein GOODEAATRI_002093, partial [Goodea atripinnis]
MKTLLPSPRVLSGKQVWAGGRGPIEDCVLALTFTQKEGTNEVATLRYLVEVQTLESQMSRYRGKGLQSGSGISRLTAFFLFTVSKGT